MKVRQGPAGVHGDAMMAHEVMRLRSDDTLNIVDLQRDLRATALDAVAAGFETYMRLSATRPVTPEGDDSAVAALRNADVVLDNK